MKIKVKAKIAPHKEEKVEINSDYIQLQAFLKFIGVAETGGAAKVYINSKMIKVNGEICTARGRKLRENDVVSAFATDYTIVKNEN